MKNGTVMTIDLKGFNKGAQLEDAPETAIFLMAYYGHVEDSLASRGWRFVKGMGDCIMVVAEGDVDTESIQEFFEEISEKHPVTILFRRCQFVEQQVNIGAYACLDIIGKDICDLFLRDEHTTKLG